MNLIRARLQLHVRHRARRPAQLRFEVVGRNIHRLNRLDRRHQNLQQPGPLVIIDSLDLIVVAHAHLSVHFCLKRTGSVEKLRVLERRARGARDQVQQALIVPIRAHRGIREGVRVDVSFNIRSIRLQLWRRARDLHGFAHIARLQNGIDASRGIHLHHYSAAPLFLKTIYFDRHRIDTRRDVRKYIVAALVRRPGAGNIRVGFCNSNLGVGNNRPGGIRHGT